VRARHLLPGVLPLTLLAGCLSSGDPESRPDHVAALAARQAEDAAALLPADGALSLDDCIHLALERNLILRSTELERQLAEIDTDIAFANFLPRIEANFNRNMMSEPPVIDFGGQQAQISDQRVTDLTFTAYQPLFTPQAWLLHSAVKKGEDVAELALARTRQLVVLQVTALYHSCLELAAAQGGLVAEVQHAEVLRREIEARAAEGLVNRAVREEAELFVMAKWNDLEANHRALIREKAGLLASMDLPPLTPFRLAPPPPPVSRPEIPLEDLVTDALLRRPELHLSDRVIDIRRDEVRMAVAAFLPDLFAYGGYSTTTDSFLVFPNFWLLGFTGALTLFDGLRNIGEHDAAELRVEQALLEREEQALAVILEVLEARRIAEDARSSRRLAEQNRAAVEARLVEVEALWGEGMAEESDRLQALADRARALAMERVTEYRERVALATLDDVTGYGRSDG
jgi:outer membrane protein TolC